MRNFETWIRRVTVVVGCFVLCLMMLQVVVDVFLRTFAGAGFPATPDLVSKYYMVAVSFLPLALTEVKRRHIEATIFTEKLTGRARDAVFLLGFAIGTAVFSVLFWGTAQEAISQTARGSYVEAGVVRFLTWPSYWILPVSFGLMTVMLALRVAQVLGGRFTDAPHDPLDELTSNSDEAS